MPIIFIKHIMQSGMYICVSLRSHGVVIAKGSSTDCTYIDASYAVFKFYQHHHHTLQEFLNTSCCSSNMLMTLLAKCTEYLAFCMSMYTHCYWIFYANWSTLRLLCYEIPRLTRIHFHKHLYLPLRHTQRSTPFPPPDYIIIYTIAAAVWWRSTAPKVLYTARWYWSGCSEWNCV